MDFINLTLISTLAFLQAHTALAYLVLFVGSFLETLVGIGFFIYGEFLFLPAAILAGSHVLDIWLVIISLVGGGIVGDSVSFFLGAHYGIKIFKDEARFLNHTNRKKGEEFFQKYGDKGIFLARLLGPLSWITPFLAGVYAVPYRRFLKYNIPGVMVGIGQFIIVGYFFGSQYKEILNFIQTYMAIIIFSLLILFIIYLGIKRNYPQFFQQISELWRYEKRKLLKNVLKHMTSAIAIIFVVYVTFLYILFFTEGGSKPRLVRSDLPIFANLEELNTQTNFVTFKSGSKDPVQPVNVVLISSGDIGEHFKNNDWLKDVLFSEANLTAKAFIRLWRDHEPPVSDLYLDDYPQELAFQERTQSSLHRLHIRLWPVGFLDSPDTWVYFGSVSNDEGLQISLYDNFPVPFHEVDPDVDLARDEIAKIFSDDPTLLVSDYQDWGKVVLGAKSDDQKYFTDGRVLLLRFK